MPQKLTADTDKTQPRLAFGYVRVSTDQQAREGYSLGEQERKLRAYFKHQGIELVELFVESGVSGRRDDRPELTKLLGRLDEVDLLGIPALSRLGRSNRHLAECFELLDGAGVELVSLAENIDTSTAAGRMLRNMLGVFAEFEGDLIAERVGSSLIARHREGRYSGGRAPFGYRFAERTEKGRPTGPLTPDPAEAPIVERIFTEYVEGKSQRGIAAGLDADRIPTRMGGKWHQGTVRQMLANPIYKGALRYDGEVVEEAEHPALIDAATWERARTIREANARTRGHGGGRLPKQPYLFIRGMLRCSCGEAMVPRSEAGTYECLRRKRLGPEGCGQPPVRRELIDTPAWASFERTGLDLDATRASLAESIERATAEVRTLRDQADTEARRADERLARVKRDYQDGKLDADDWKEQRDELTAERKAARAEAKRLATRERKIGEGADLIDAEEQTLRKLAELRATFAGKVAGSGSIDAARIALSELFDHFTLHRLVDNGDGTGDWPGHASEAIDTDLVLPGGYLIEQHPKPEAVEALAVEGLVPVLRRIPLALPGSTDVKAF